LPYEWFYLSLFSSITAYKFEIIHACFEIYSYHDKHSILVYLLTSLKLFILECFFFFFFFFFSPKQGESAFLTTIRLTSLFFFLLPFLLMF
jgi:hypothetical protein